MNGLQPTELRQLRGGLVMSNSTVFYHGRDDVIHIVDPDLARHFDELPPVFDIVVAVMNAGYNGVVVDEKRLNNGRFIHFLSVAQGTPEGNAIQNLMADANAGKPLPSVDCVLAQLKAMYEEIGDRND